MDGEKNSQTKCDHEGYLTCRKCEMSLVKANPQATCGCEERKSLGKVHWDQCEHTQSDPTAKAREIWDNLKDDVWHDTNVIAAALEAEYQRGAIEQASTGEWKTRQEYIEYGEAERKAGREEVNERANICARELKAHYERWEEALAEARQAALEEAAKLVERDYWDVRGEIEFAEKRLTDRIRSLKATHRDSE